MPPFPGTELAKMLKIDYPRYTHVSIAIVI
jgi:hypothetical protein